MYLIYDATTGQPVSSSDAFVAPPAGRTSVQLTDLEREGLAGGWLKWDPATRTVIADPAFTGQPDFPVMTGKLTADLPPITSAALANVAGLSFPVKKDLLTWFQFNVIFRTAALTTGIGLGLTVPAFTVYTANVNIPIAADGPASMLYGWLTSSGDSVLGTGVQVVATDQLAVIEGVILPSAAGTVQLQARSEIAASAVTIRNGSHYRYQNV